MLEKLETLKGQFWTDLEELREAIEELGFWVEDLNEEYVTVYSDEEDYDSTEWVINLIVAGNTITIKNIEVI